mmetsp:Transcript_24257/g.52322  ORF Transcript_24257/g.52322 Transcript_24257/m.52322 type:complete len:252 (-) Transcript_24257:403-1158(-)|eukprot:CAMPEP_0172322710 /NCGR_PEP_ID=MMETSP1058-20130122/46691_1 /TAXON_ID=83371 /ORGANISM="Detonula confervacea, Strain CCMP 353" /LENGTH=251 /DNA_ID=CAMNT_0013038523 /DNA_START=42 /DNA_END=800 /DNA_ORIENTATION=-
MSGMEIIQKLREESFNKETERRLKSHPYLKAAEEGTLTLSQRQAFAREQYFIQLSDAKSFAFLAGHRDFTPSSLTGMSVPEQPTIASGLPHEIDLFQFLLGGEVYAASLLLAYAKSVGLDENNLRHPAQSGYQLSATAQAYPSYWARLALSGKGRAAGAAACAVNFPAWGAMCHRLLEAFGGEGEGGEFKYAGVDDESLAFIKFFATPIEELDQMAASIIEKEDASYDELVEPVRLLQQYEIMFWDGIFEK